MQGKTAKYFTLSSEGYRITIQCSFLMGWIYENIKQPTHEVLLEVYLARQDFVGFWEPESAIQIIEKEINASLERSLCDLRKTVLLDYKGVFHST